MNKVVKYTGFGILGVLALFACLILSSVLSGYIGTSNHEKQFESFIEIAVPRLTEWNIQDYEELMVTEIFNEIDRQHSLKNLKKFSKLGKLVSMNKIELQNATTFYPFLKPNRTVALYLVAVTFDTGDAQVLLQLVEKKGDVRIEGFRITSKHLDE